MKTLLLAIVVVLFVSGCTDMEYIPQKVYEIETTSGEIIKLSCPAIEQGRSSLTYLIDSQCNVIKE